MTEIDDHCRAAKAHIEKSDQAKDRAEQHLISAAQHIKAIKGLTPDQAAFLEIVKLRIGIGKSRTYEILPLADGTKTVDEIRERGREKERRTRADAALVRHAGQTEDDDIPPFLDRITDRRSAPVEPDDDEPGDDNAPRHTTPDFIRNAPDVVASALDIIMGMSCQQWQRLMYLLDQNERLPVRGTEEGDAVLEAGRRQLETAAAA